MSHTYQSVLQHLIGYLHNKLEGSPEVNENSHFIRNLDIDSMQVFEIVEELEDTYQIVVPLELLYKQQRIQTVSDLAKEVMRLLEKKS